MVDIKKKLLKLGKVLKSFRKSAGYTQPELSSISGVSTSIVNDLENGIRTAGCNTIDKIARGLQLEDEDRFRLLLSGLELSKRDFVIPDFTSFPPEIINFLPYILNKSGITPDSIKEVTLGENSKEALVITTVLDNKISLEIKLSPKS
jgi:transcriptional regulator with XRE-family HTH domain